MLETCSNRNCNCSENNCWYGSKVLIGDMSWLPYSPYLMPLNFLFWSYFRHQICVPPLPLSVEHLDELTLNPNSIPENTYSSTSIGISLISVCHWGFIRFYEIYFKTIRIIVFTLYFESLWMLYKLEKDLKTSWINSILQISLQYENFTYI